MQTTSPKLGKTGERVAKYADMFSAMGTEPRLRIMQLLLIVNGTAPIAAPIIGVQLLRFTSWRGVFAVLAVVGAVLLIVAAGWLPETLPAARRHRGGARALLRDGGRLVTDREFTGYALASGLAFGAMFA